MQDCSWSDYVKSQAKLNTQVSVYVDKEQREVQLGVTPTPGKQSSSVWGLRKWTEGPE